MTDRPIIFSAPMVRAILDGRKTMTRRPAWRGGPRVDGGLVEIRESRPSPWRRVKPGYRLWVRETVCLHCFGPLTIAHYRADRTASAAEVADEPKWKPAIHMPRWASRITLIVTETKIERLQAISEEDAKAEGLMQFADGGFSIDGGADSREGTARDCFAHLWDRLHGPGSWDANPEVVALTFRREDAA